MESPVQAKYPYIRQTRCARGRRDADRIKSREERELTAKKSRYCS